MLDESTKPLPLLPIPRTKERDRQIVRWGHRYLEWMPNADPSGKIGGQWKDID